MKVTGDMELQKVWAIDEEKILNTLAWLAPELGRLQYPNPLRVTLGCVTVRQAARITRIPLSEMLYVLNLAAGETEEDLSEELRSNAFGEQNNSVFGSGSGPAFFVIKDFDGDRDADVLVASPL